MYCTAALVQTILAWLDRILRWYANVTVCALWRRKPDSHDRYGGTGRNDSHERAYTIIMPGGPTRRCSCPLRARDPSFFEGCWTRSRQLNAKPLDGDPSHLPSTLDPRATQCYNTICDRHHATSFALCRCAMTTDLDKDEIAQELE